MTIIQPNLTATFLQVYKLLSAYSILKPLKSGKILETATPKIFLNDIKEVFNANESSRFKKLQNLTSRLDEILNSDGDEKENLQIAFRDHLEQAAMGYTLKAEYKEEAKTDEKKRKKSNDLIYNNAFIRHILKQMLFSINISYGRIT
ncbi:hypothetical protein QTP88_015455 [Uroleucon formosanum]